MNPQLQNTAALRDIHLPDAVSWWPPAIGWWLVLIILLLAIYFLPKLYRRITYLALNTVSQQAFDKIRLEHSQNNDTKQLIEALSKLLRQISMSYYGREKVAQLTGDMWLDSLNSLTDINYFTPKLRNALINAPYQKNISIDANELLLAIQNWINALPNKTKNRTHKASIKVKTTA